MQLQVRNSPFSEEEVQLLNQLLGKLTGTQRVWLSGYLTAEIVSDMGATQQEPAHMLQEVQVTETKEITVLYGTQTGNAQSLAETFTEQLLGNGLKVNAICMNEFKARDIKKLSHVLIIISTHGEGDPPDNAIEFCDFIHSKRAPKLNDLHYSVLALGDSSYEQFCLTGKQIDERLEALGATRIADRIDCDVDFDEDAENWFTSVSSELQELTTTSTKNIANTTNENKVTSLYSRTNPFEAEVLENINLNGRGSNKETRHIELSIEDANLKFEPGDSIGIYPENDPQLVEQLITSFGWEKDQEITIKDHTWTVENALKHHYEITRLTKPILEKIASTFQHEKLTTLLQDEQKNTLMEYIENHDLLDLVEDYSLQNVSPDELLPLLRKIPARLYSVASSYRANPDEVHLTVGVVRYHAGERDRNGVCSVQLSERIEPGDKVKIYVHKNDYFRLPEDDQVPIIMIGPGTGIAPFRSFMEEREEIEAKGKSWLFFGDQHYRTDFLYQIEWQRWIKQGVLTKLDLAFSRDQEEKVYVQHKMWEEKALFYQWLEEGAIIYVCGDEKSMAKDVHDTILRIIQEEGNKSEEEATAYLKTMQQQKRYQRDVY
ncbi:assimilatory sulfite reductase (NADPH) flavoprotein subunit [Pseudogracilibacillus sp. ICA-222130]|uniref:assimilatory sulfite reductase (NADPH) flavoprotein subunit n=1 Tax=Pseudogracilibacillus sp. ICA-222130 TaxID=3134655 RepID=UPI0030BAB46B